MHTIRILGKPWAIDLWWQTFESGQRLKRTARTAATNIKASSHGEVDFNCFVLRDKPPFQAGFSENQDFSVGKAIPSLALAMATVRTGTWLGRFAFDDGVWIVAVKDGAILPEGDFFGSEEAAAGRIAELEEEVGQWEDLLETEDEGESFRVLEKHLGGVARSRQPKFRPVVAQLPVKKFLVYTTVFGTVVLICVGINGYFDAQENARIQGVAQKKQQEMALAAERRAAEQGRFWQKLPLPSAVIQDCWQEFSGIEIFKKGWSVSKWECGAESQLTTWAWSAGASFEDLPEGGILSLESPLQVEVPKPATKKLPPLEMKTLKDLKEAPLPLFEIARVLAVDLQVGNKLSANKLGLRGVKIAEWNLSGFKSFPSPIVLKRVDQICGAVIKALKWDRVANVWTIEGEMYGYAK